MDTFIIKDGGKRTEFESGMVRDTAEGKTDWELVFNGPMLERWAIHLTKGNAKYPDPEPGKANWQRAAGIEEQVRFRKAAARHFAQWMRGDQDEDHASAVFFNLNGYEYVKALRAGTVAPPTQQPTPRNSNDVLYVGMAREQKMTNYEISRARDRANVRPDETPLSERDQ